MCMRMILESGQCASVLVCTHALVQARSRARGGDDDSRLGDNHDHDYKHDRNHNYKHDYKHHYDHDRNHNYKHHYDHDFTL